MFQRQEMPILRPFKRFLGSLPLERGKMSNASKKQAVTAKIRRDALSLARMLGEETKTRVEKEINELPKLSRGRPRKLPSSNL
jgi:hypothetical protein